MTRDELIKEFRNRNLTVRCSTLETRHVLIDALKSLNPNEDISYLTDDFSANCWPYMGLNSRRNGWCLWMGANPAATITAEELLAMIGFSPAEDSLCVASLEDVL